MSVGGVRVTVTGARAIIRALHVLPSRVQKRVIRRAVTRVSRLLAKRAKETISGGTDEAVDTGLLKKSIGFRVKSPKGAPWVIIGVIGPRRGFGTLITRKGKALTRGGISKVVAGGGGFTRSQYADPARYGHLVEGGRKAKGKHPGVRARPFMEHTHIRSATQMGIELRRSIHEGIAIEARKLARSHGN